MDEYIRIEDAVGEVEFGITLASKINIETGEWTELFQRENDELRNAVERIKSLPAADVVPVVHGHWEYIDDTYCGFKDTDVRCSVCKTTTNIKHFRKTKWCPDCGALMDGKRKDGEHE